MELILIIFLLFGTSDIKTLYVDSTRNVLSFQINQDQRLGGLEQDPTNVNESQVSEDSQQEDSGDPEEGDPGEGDPGEGDPEETSEDEDSEDYEGDE